MSRIGKQIITIPEKTEVTLSDDGMVTVKGPKGELVRQFRNDVIDIAVEDDTLSFTPLKKSPFALSLWGTYASQVKSMVTGVNEPFEKKLIVEGVGFRSEVQGDNLILTVGFSHPVSLAIPQGLTVTAEKNVVSVSGINKEVVGQFAAQIRATKKPEPYKGKGIRYENEIIKRKQGKKAV